MTKRSIAPGIWDAAFGAAFARLILDDKSGVAFSSSAREFEKRCADDARAIADEAVEMCGALEP
jgi:hypothetical protein